MGVPYLASVGLERMVWNRLLEMVAEQDRERDARHWRNFVDGTTAGVSKALARLFRKV